MVWTRMPEERMWEDGGADEAETICDHVPTIFGGRPERNLE